MKSTTSRPRSGCTTCDRTTIVGGLTDRSIAQEEKRRLILDAAVHVFARKGYHVCRVGDITEEAGVAHGLLYHYFPSKEQVLETVFREILERGAGRVHERRGLGRVAAGAAAPRRRDPAPLLAAQPRPRPRARARDRAEPAGAEQARRVRPCVRVDRADRRARPAATAPSAPTSTRAWRRSSSTARSRRSSPAGSSARWPDGDEEVAAAERAVVDVVCDGIARSVISARRGIVWILGLGAFGLAFSITTTAAYLPPLLERFTDSNTMIAAVLAAEGVFALTLPLVIGPWSDTFKTPMGRRRPFMLAALGPIGFCLAHPRLHAEHLDGDADRARVLLRLLRLRASVPRALPGRAAREHVRALAGRAARHARDRARARARRRRLPLPRLAAGPVPARLRSRPPPRAARRSCSSTRRRTRARGSSAGVRSYVRTSWQRLPRRARGAALPARERGLGGHVRGDADVRRPLHHARARRSRSRRRPRCWRRSRSAT